jgi:hypothetical protein
MIDMQGGITKTLKFKKLGIHMKKLTTLIPIILFFASQQSALANEYASEAEKMGINIVALCFAATDFQVKNSTNKTDKEFAYAVNIAYAKYGQNWSTSEMNTVGEKILLGFNMSSAEEKIQYYNKCKSEKFMPTELISSILLQIYGLTK